MEVADEAAVAAAVQQIIDSDAQVVMIATPTASAIALLQTLEELGEGPSSLPTFGTTSNMTLELVEGLGG